MSNRDITISVGESRWSLSWQSVHTTVSELFKKLSTPQRSFESIEEFMRLPKKQQDRLKDIGGFVGGQLQGTRRKGCAVTGRDLITLDFDNIPGFYTENIKRIVDGLDITYCIYSTRKHTSATPRLRIIIPLDRTVTADEYEPIARRLADYIGIGMADPTTFEPSRLMYWPSCSSDSEFVYFVCEDKPFAQADELLATYNDWHNFLEWPQVPNAKNYQKLATQQGDPEEKKGIVGAFCRTYDVYSAMDRFLPGIYEPCSGSADRYTYLGGSTTGGAVVYDNGKFLYSHHATDPCSGRLVNAFDMVRLHKFADKDIDSADDTPVSRLPSYAAMTELANADEAVAVTINKERQTEIERDFGGITTPAEADEAWVLDRDKNGKPKNTIDNVLLVLEHDKLLQDRIVLNQFANRGEVVGALPWDKRTERRIWSDADNSGMYWYMQKYYLIDGKSNIDAALDIHGVTHGYNEVQDYLTTLEWDGKKRLETIFIDYLGADDNKYNRAVSRKAFVAAVARAMDPGCKFDNMLILAGPQGIGKSTLLDKISCGWFNDSIRTFEGKEASELLQGVWLVEISELDAFRRTDVSRIKQFLSLRADRYRAAYGRHVKELPRRCVFFGTTNTVEFLQDSTGNRRFWPVDVGIKTCKQSVWSIDQKTINQLWAEAYAYWQLGEPLYLTGDVADSAVLQQENHREMSTREELIRDFVEKPIPKDWNSWPLANRRAYWGDVEAQKSTPYELVPRDRICSLEVWCELFFGTPKDYTKIEAREINSVLYSLKGWQSCRSVSFGADYGQRRGFIRKDETECESQD